MATLKQRVHRYNGSSYDTVHYETQADLVTYTNNNQSNVKGALDDLYNTTSEQGMLNSFANSTLNNANPTPQNIYTYFNITRITNGLTGNTVSVGETSKYTLSLKSAYIGSNIYISVINDYYDRAYSQSNSSYSYPSSIRMDIDIDNTYSNSKTISIPSAKAQTYTNAMLPALFYCKTATASSIITITYTVLTVVTGSNGILMSANNLTYFNGVSKKYDVDIYP